MDQVILSIEQICAEFSGVSYGAVRRWIDTGLLAPVKRSTTGRGGRLYFRRGDVAKLLHVVCPVCGNGFQRATLKQEFCSTRCRQKAHRLKGKA